MIFTYKIKKYTPDYLLAEVEDADDVVFILETLPNGTTPLIDTGHMRHVRHVDGLARYLMDIGVMFEDDELIDSVENKDFPIPGYDA